MYRVGPFTGKVANCSEVRDQEDARRSAEGTVEASAGRPSENPHGEFPIESGPRSPRSPTRSRTSAPPHIPARRRSPEPGVLASALAIDTVEGRRRGDARQLVNKSVTRRARSRCRLNVHGPRGGQAVPGPGPHRSSSKGTKNMDNIFRSLTLSSRGRRGSRASPLGVHPAWGPGSRCRVRHDSLARRSFHRHRRKVATPSNPRLRTHPGVPGGRLLQRAGQRVGLAARQALREPVRRQGGGTHSALKSAIEQTGGKPVSKPTSRSRRATRNRSSRSPRCSRTPASVPTTAPGPRGNQSRARVRRQHRAGRGQATRPRSTC